MLGRGECATLHSALPIVKADRQIEETEGKGQEPIERRPDSALCPSLSSGIRQSAESRVAGEAGPVEKTQFVNLPFYSIRQRAD